MTVYSVCAASLASAQTTAPAKPAETVTANNDLRFVGIGGHYRTGHWTAVRVDDLSVNVGDEVTIETTDGDGTPIRYRQVIRDGNSQTCYCKPGIEASPLVISSTATERPRTLLKTRFPTQGETAEGPAMIPLGMPWALVIGSPLGIESIGANELLDRGASVAVTTVDDVNTLPDETIGYDGVDFLFITSSGIPQLRAMSSRQQQALQGWVTSGGRALITLGENADELLAAAPWIANLLPSSVSEAEIARLSPSGFETYTNSQTRLTEFSAKRLPKIGRRDRVGQQLIAGRTTRRVSLPLAARFVAGLGKITVLSADLEAKPFSTWPQRLDLLLKLTSQELDPERDDVGTSARMAGYSDLAGQMRRSLDRFETKRSVRFSVVALIIAALIALVGPLDYLLIRRQGRGPWLGWLTFPTVAIVLSVGLVMASAPKQVSPGTSNNEQTTANNSVGLRSNSIEVLDIDSVTGTGRLFRWSHLYSHEAVTVSLESEVSPTLTDLAAEIRAQLISPLGAPGPAMGGIQISLAENAYEILTAQTDHSSTSSDTEAGDPDKSIHARLSGLQLAPRSSKSLCTEMAMHSDLTMAPMRRRSGSELLSGSVTNPLGTDLLDGMLIYKNWVYLLPTRFPAGETIVDIDTLTQKNFRWRLSRQRALESSSQSERWDVTQVDRPVRLAEMFLFHEAAGGARYTSLRNEVLDHYDLSDLLTDDRCMLVGRTKNSWTQQHVRLDDGTEIIEPPGTASTWVRLVMSVEEEKR